MHARTHTHTRTHAYTHTVTRTHTKHTHTHRPPHTHTDPPPPHTHTHFSDIRTHAHIHTHACTPLTHRHTHTHTPSRTPHRQRTARVGGGFVTRGEGSAERTIWNQLVSGGESVFTDAVLKPRGGEGWMWRMSEGSNFHCFGAQLERKQCWPKVFVLWWIRSIRVSAEERSCLEGVYTVRRLEKSKSTVGSHVALKKKKKCIQNCTVADAYCLSGVRCAIIGQFGWSGRRAPGEIKRSRDLRGGRWSWTLTFAQKRSWVGRWSWAEQVGRLLLRVVQVVHQQRCNGHCLSDSVQHSSWKSNCTVHKSLGNGEGTPP